MDNVEMRCGLAVRRPCDHIQAKIMVVFGQMIVFAAERLTVESSQYSRPILEKLIWRVAPTIKIVS